MSLTIEIPSPKKGMERSQFEAAFLGVLHGEDTQVQIAALRYVRLKQRIRWRRSVPESYDQMQTQLLGKAAWGTYRTLTLYLGKLELATAIEEAVPTWSVLYTSESDVQISR